MINYYPHIHLSLAEIPGKSTLIIYGLTGCMFQCYGCFNYNEIVKKRHSLTYNIQDVVAVIMQQEVIIDCLVFSGGEYLMAPIDHLIVDLKQVRKVTNKPIIIYTTGYYLQKMKHLWQLHLVDGFHVDMKLPYHLLSDDDEEIIIQTLGYPLNNQERSTLLEALEWTVQFDRGFNQIRSIRYPFLDESAFHECQQKITQLNQKYHKATPYHVNPFHRIKQD